MAFDVLARKQQRKPGLRFICYYFPNILNYMVPIRGSDLSACDSGVLAGFGHGETGSESPAHGIRNHIFLFLFFPPQACPRLSIFSATSPQQTETAHASLHARDPAQPYNARIFRRLDASKCFSLPPGLAPFG